MPKIKKINGFYHDVTFSVLKRKGYDTVYLTGNFNCMGEGSFSLRGNRKLKCKITLPPGIYSYKILVNQVYSIDEEGKPIKNPRKFAIPLDSAFHDPTNSGFASIYGNIMRLIVAVPKTFNSVFVELRSNVPQIISKSRHNLENYDLIEFVVKPVDEYRFLIDGKKLPNRGYYRCNIRPERRYEKTGIIYHIFPDRFNRSGNENIDGLASWNEAPTATNFFGGNLNGIAEKLDYLESLGVEFVYLNPIFKSRSNHRYNVDDYFTVDPLLGTNEDFRYLVNALHERKMKIILDVPFNHSSTDFPPFADSAIRGKKSPYFLWYKFHRIRPDYLRSWGRKKARIDGLYYETFENVPEMPKLNHDNLDVMEYFRSVTEFWALGYDVDGFRYDVAISIPRDFIEFTTARLGKKFLKIGEAWCLSSLFLRSGFWDGVTNYYLRDAIIGLVNGSISCDKFNAMIARANTEYGSLKMQSMMNILDSHDTERILETMNNSIPKTKAVFSILYLLDGFATIYYGDEVGLEGGPDPDSRRPFPWEKMNRDLLDFVISLANIRYLLNLGNPGIISASEDKNWISIKKILEDKIVTLSISKRNQQFISKDEPILSSGLSSNNGRKWIEKNGIVLFSSTTD
ncbi:MAG: glycoside hydrolase family 13 protein [Thermoplasmatales archaeon]